MVMASNLVQMRLISYKSIIELGAFWNVHILAKFRYAHFTQRLLTKGKKNPAKNIFLQSCLFEKQILCLKRAKEAGSS